LVVIIVRRDFSAQVRHYIQIVDEQKFELEQANKELSELAMRDGLTGLINHRTFQERLADEFARTERHFSPLSLLMIDVDHFKAYNDAFGHPAGDALLKRLAELLADSARASDIVARYGGEEFAILLPVTDTAGAVELAERLRIRIETADWQSAGITVSVGVAACGRDRQTPGQLLAHADKALYKSKADGRNRVTIASGENFTLA